MGRAVALIDAESPGGGRVVTVRGEVDVGSAPSLRDWLARASEGGRRSVVIDMRNVTFLAISGLYVLCDEQLRMATHRARLTVICTDPRALQLFSVCRLDDVLRVVSTREEVVGGPWTPADEERAERVRAWLQRYAAESA
ncbi:MAG TPA: STAS domain-containing protein [Solirubrobacteraceae bacterium]|nr:STAS domain-containing protein [Solirubrobacteraceae bacterium]